MLQLHAQVVNDYVAAVQRISELEANQPVAIGTDDRALAQVVSHIAEWEQFKTMAAVDILAALIPARHASDQQIVAALAYE
jgi:ABC-type lipoprotein release transport system permease subunit